LVKFIISELLKQNCKNQRTVVLSSGASTIPFDSGKCDTSLQTWHWLSPSL